MSGYYLVGIQKVDFVADDGKRICGFYYYLAESNDYSLVGCSVIYKKWSKELLPVDGTLEFGSRVAVTCDMRGNLKSIEII